ncbi:MAG TPA: hypothetical protein VHS80_06345 [Chthoniobacterales bacterium]|jgi:hypothetical protein|nr:hypothetical protein [Chthoniobacterales bacterium]
MDYLEVLQIYLLSGGPGELASERPRPLIGLARTTTQIPPLNTFNRARHEKEQSINYFDSHSVRGHRLGGFLRLRINGRI